MSERTISAAVSKRSVKDKVSEVLLSYVLKESVDDEGGDVTLVDALSVDDDGETGRAEIHAIAREIADGMCQFDIASAPISPKWVPEESGMYWFNGWAGPFETSTDTSKELLDFLVVCGNLFKSKEDAEECFRARKVMKLMRDAEDGGKLKVYATFDGRGVRITGVGFSSREARSNFLNHVTKDDLNLVAKLMYGGW